MENFKYLGQPKEQTDNDWPEVWKKIMRARAVWERLGMLLRREGAYPKVVAMF